MNKLAHIKKTISNLEKSLIKQYIDEYRSMQYPNQIEKLSDFYRFMGLPCQDNGYPIQSEKDKLERLLKKYSIKFAKVSTK